MLGKLIKPLKVYWIFLLIVFAAALFRLAALSDMPPALNWDEISHGYNAYSLLETGKDEWGEKLPVIFRAYGDYKLPLYIYTTAVSVAVFGLNEFAVRLPSALAGIGTVILTYFLVLELLKKDGQESEKNSKPVALIGMFLTATEPWSLFLSRAAFEANLAVFFIAAGLYFFLKGFSKTNFFILSVISFGLSVWTYNSARIFVPLFILFLILIYRIEIISIYKQEKRISIILLFTAAIFFIPMFIQLVNPIGQARYGKVSIIDEGAVAEIIELRNQSSVNPIISRFIYNRPVYFLQKFTLNYISHFSPRFLFTEGGNHYQFSVPSKGLLYLADAPFIILGLYGLFKRRSKAALLLLPWFFLSPVASALTREAPHALRASVMLPLPMILTAFGIDYFSRLFRNKFYFVMTFAYIAIILLMIESYLISYFGNYKKNYSWSWQYGYKDVVKIAQNNYSDYEKIIVTKKYGEPHEFFLFYWPWDPEKYIKDPGLIRFYQSDWYWVDGFDKFYFVNDWDIPKEKRQEFVLESGQKFSCGKEVKCLLITGAGNAPEGWDIKDTVYFLDGKIAFEIYEN